MKKSLIKNVTNSVLSLCLITLLSVSCSPSDDAPETSTEPTVTFTSLSASKTDGFTEEKIILTIDGTNYTDVSVTSTNSNIIISKFADSAYEISATTATSNAYVNVEISNKTKKISKAIAVSFYEHGVKNARTVEGITIDVDKSANLLRVLGEPEQKADLSDGVSEVWNYPAKGLDFIIVKKSTIVNQINMVSSNYSITKDNIKINYTTYPYEIGNGWKVNNTTMDVVVDKLGTPTLKSTSSTSLTNRAYQYSNQRIVFRFYSDSEDNYTGKKIIYYSIY